MRKVIVQVSNSIILGDCLSPTIHEIAGTQITVFMGEETNFVKAEHNPQLHKYVKERYKEDFEEVTILTPSEITIIMEVPCE